MRKYFSVPDSRASVDGGGGQSGGPSARVTDRLSQVSRNCSQARVSGHAGAPCVGQRYQTQPD